MIFRLLCKFLTRRFLNPDMKLPISVPLSSKSSSGVSCAGAYSACRMKEHHIEEFMWEELGTVSINCSSLSRVYYGSMYGTMLTCWYGLGLPCWSGGIEEVQSYEGITWRERLYQLHVAPHHQTIGTWTLLSLLRLSATVIGWRRQKNCVTSTKYYGSACTNDEECKHRGTSMVVIHIM